MPPSVWKADGLRVHCKGLYRRLSMLDLAFILLGAGTLIALAVYAAALDRL
jgi:hypothetical protein